MTARNKTTPSFSEALEEVETILARLEEGEVDIDDLSAEVKRAVELVDLCREKLHRTELEVKEFVGRLEEDGSGTPPAADDTPPL